MSKAKKSKNNPDIRNQAAPQMGKKVRFIGLNGSTRQCNYCGASFANSMISEYNRKLYCDEKCIVDENRS